MYLLQWFLLLAVLSRGSPFSTFRRMKRTDKLPVVKVINIRVGNREDKGVLQEIMPIPEPQATNIC